MLKLIIGIIFAGLAFYLTEKDNKDGDLYKILHKKDK